MNFFKSLKSKLLGSVKEDLNSALGGQRASFNSKISGALDDLIAMKTGIQLSNIPSKITEEALLMAEGRAAAEKAIGQSNAQIMASVKPSNRSILRFPTDDNRFVDNWIIFRTIKKTHQGVGMIPDGSSKEAHGLLTAADKVLEDGSIIDTKHATDDCTIMLYFPNNVKDVITVDYEVKDIGLSDIAFNDPKSLLDIGVLEGMGDEAFAKLRESLVSFEQLQSGVVTGNPKFNTFQGVGFRNHSYSFSLNPYNVTDANEITKIIHWFKTMMLPMSMSDNRRQMLMPAEWSIDFKGPILGHIEHPQNCFLTSCDVDYSGGKDMSFIESDANQDESNDGFRLSDNLSLQHYPNGINLNLTFQEILNIDRIRYIDRVAANAKGQAQDVGTELKDFETQLSADIKADATATEEADKKAGLDKSYRGTSGRIQAQKAAAKLGSEYEVYVTNPSAKHVNAKQYKVRKKDEG